jgi:hypothetical protein
VRGPDELDGGVPAVRTGPKASEWRRGYSGRVGVTPASNLGRGEGNRANASSGEGGGTPRAKTRAQDGAKLTKHRVGVANQRDRAPASAIHYGKAKSGQLEHGNRFLTLGQHSRRLGVASGTPGGRHGGHSPPASSGGDG